MRTRAQVKTGLEVLALLVAAPGCGINAPVYVDQEMPMQTPAAGGALSQTVTLRFRAPTEEDRQYLRDLKSKQTVQPRYDVPWLQRRDVALSLQYTITNLSDRPGRAQVMIDGATEFTLYDPGAIRNSLVALLGEEEAGDVFLPSLIETTPIMIPARGQVSGNIREDEFGEAALDLDAMGRFMGNYVALLIHRSEQKPLGLEMVPPALEVPQLQRVIVTLTASTQMRLEFVLRVRDEQGILADDGERPWNPNPTPFVPMVEGAMPMMQMMQMTAAPAPMN